MRRCFPFVLLLVAMLSASPNLLAQTDPADRPTASEKPKFRSHRDLVYTRVDGRELKLDLFLPVEELREPIPLVIWVHGGGWRGGSKDLPLDRVTAAAERGFALASISYRLSNVAIYPAQIHDVKAAVRWLRAHAEDYQLDPQRFGAWGASAGGHLVALLATGGDVPELEGTAGNLDQSSRVQAVCDWFGPTDFLQFDEHQQSGQLRANEAGSLIALLLGGVPQQVAELARLASPLQFVTSDDPPLLIMHGDRDRIVPHRQSVVLRDALQQAGIEVELVTLEGAGHGDGDFGSPQTHDRVWEFFSEHLHVKD